MISFTTTAADVLLKAFDDSIAAGRITTWEKGSAGFYHHKAERWKNKGFFAASQVNGRLDFKLTIVEGNVPTGERLSVYAYYHGHLHETFLNHFREMFTGVLATPKPLAGETAV